MGLMSFIKEAGRKLGIGKAEATQPEGSPVPETPTAAALEEEVKNLGLDVKDLAVEVQGDTVKVSGTTPDQATKEKLLVALGNVAGVAAVDESVTAETAEPEAVIYVVKKGDTLSAIAKEALRQGVEVHGDLRGQPPDAEASRQDLSRPGAANSAGRRRQILARQRAASWSRQ